MRIAVVGPTFPYKGGIAQHTTQLAHRLAAVGHQVSLESWSAQYPGLLYPGEQRVTEPELPTFPNTRYPLSWRRPDGWVRLGRRLRRDVDGVVLVLVTPVQAPALWVIQREARPGPRLLVLCHNVLPHERRRVDRELVRRVLSASDAVLVHSEPEREQAQALTGAPVTVSSLPPPHPFSTGHAPAADRPVTRRLLFFGLVRPYKGLDILLRALARGPADVRLVVAGEFWGGTGETEKLITELGIGDRVELRAGYVPAADVPGLLTGSDALVLPYRSSTASWNGSLGHEHGVPVVASRVGTMAEQVRDGVDGLLVEPEDVEALATALRRLYAPGELQRLRAGVRPPDGEGQWDAYVAALTAALAPPTGLAPRRPPAAPGARRRVRRAGSRTETPMAAERAPQLAYSELMDVMLDEPGRRRKAAKILAVLRHFLGRDDFGGLDVADVGCSAGYIADELAKAGSRLTLGFDIDVPGLTKAERRFGDSVSFVCAAGEALPLPDDSLDVIVFNHIYEHVVDPEAVIADMRRVLRPGGALYLGLANRLGVVEPHYRLPFLSYLPPAAADRYVRTFGRADHYYERLRTRRGLRGLLGGFTVWDYTFSVIGQPELFSSEDLVPTKVAALPQPALALLRPILPTYIWVATKTPARPAGPALAVPPQPVPTG